MVCRGLESATGVVAEMLCGGRVVQEMLCGGRVVQEDAGRMRIGTKGERDLESSAAASFRFSHTVFRRL